MALIFSRMRNWFGDPVLGFTVLALTLFGVGMIYSAGQLDVIDRSVVNVWRMQLVWLAISLVALFLIMRIQMRWFEWAALPAYILSIVLLVAVLIIGVGLGTAAGTKQWIRVGGFMFQPSMFAVIAAILMMARVMGSWREPPRTLFDLWKPVTLCVVPMLLVLAEPDLGVAMVYGAVLIATLFWGGVPMGLMFMLLSPMFALFLAFQNWLFAVYMIGLFIFLYFYRVQLWEGALVVVGNLAAGTIAVPVWNAMKPYQKARLLVFLDPSIDPRGSGYHVIQSRVAIGSGGLTGKGFTQGTQKRLSFLPEQHTDFIFAVIGEELGLIGALAVLIAFGVILWRLARISERVPDPFAGIVVFGIFGAWFAHVLVNIGMTVGVMPITGIPLPFISYGGSFLLATYIALGLCQRVAAEQGRI